MAVDVMRMPVAKAFTRSDVDISQSARIFREHSVDRTASSVSLQHISSESFAPRASSRSVRRNSFAVSADDEASQRSSEYEAVDRRGSTATRIVDHGDIEGLISQLDQTKIENVGPSSSRTVQVPKGFRLGMAYDVSKFYEQRSDARRFDKRKRDLGVLSKHAGPQKHGFRPEELLWYGAIDLKEWQDCNLDNDIHPLLDRDQFDDTPDYIYDQLMPGLRLASLFLSHPSCMQFWVTLAKGDRRADHVMSERYHRTRHRISRNVAMSKENVKEVIRYIHDLGKAKAIHFNFAPGLAFQGSAAFGTAHTICNFQSDGESRGADNVQCCHVRLHSDFYVIAKKLSTLRYPDPAQKLRYNFILATLIVHEMAHAIELSQWRNRAPSPFEPFLLHHNEAELGRQWESYVFGGQVAPINDRVDGIYGVATWNWPQPFGEMEPERTICYSVPMQYISKIQQKSTWKEEYKLNNCQTRFHIPRDGATSIYLNTVTTVSWTEEERAAKETLQEQQVQDAEEPAKKKRETADGHALPIKAVGTEPENIAGPGENHEQGMVAKQDRRVKREPKGVLSRKQRRMQKKMEVKALEAGATKEIEEAALLELEEPKESEQLKGMARSEFKTVANGETAVEDQLAEASTERSVEVAGDQYAVSTKAAADDDKTDTAGDVGDDKVTQKEKK
ncbi:MAG: hypothetical protein Q9182_005678 [Xanthomendoza sp. 2 TL-2023]